jgi:hypothetical protein
MFAGSPIVLTYLNDHTSASVGVLGKASDTGVAGVAAESRYIGGFSQTFTGLLPNGNAPTPQNMQLYFCPSGVCTAADFQSGKSVTTSQSGSFTASVAGDYNRNRTVDAADYTIWRDTLGSTTDLRADSSGNGVIDQADYDVWKANFGIHSGSGAGANAAVPEPATLMMFLVGIVTIVLSSTTKKCRKLDRP